MQSKKAILSFFITILLLGGYFFGTIYYYDPLKIFHKPWVYPQYLHQNMREQALGIIKNWEFDSVILGSSMTANTSSREASQYFGGKFVNLSPMGSDAYERSLIFDTLFKTKKTLRTVIYSLDYLGLVRYGEPSFHLKHWDFLHDNNPFNDIKIYFNDKYMKCLFSIQNKKVCMGEKRDFDRPNAWYGDKNKIHKFGGLEHWFTDNPNAHQIRFFKEHLETIEKIHHHNIIKVNQKQLETDMIYIKKYLDTYILHYVKEHPDTQFIFFLPSYSQLSYGIMAQYDQPKFEKFIASIRYLVKQSIKYQNMQIFAWGNNKFTRDINNYRDLEHHSHFVNSWQLKYIHDKSGLLNNTNIESYLNRFINTSKHYDLSYFKYLLKEYFKSKK